MKDKMSEKQLSIRLYGEPVGVLEQTPTGKMAFNYHESASQAISIGMPIRETPYGEEACEAYFGGLLPESEITKKIIGKRYGISPNNTFSLLKAIGHDCAGAISCHEIQDPVASQSFFPLTARIISDDELYEHIVELPITPLFLDVDGLRLSLAGVQDKAAVCMSDHHIALAENGCPTTHIIKPASKYFDGIVENEYFCLKLAKRMGLPVANVEMKKIKDIVFLLIERYDRKIENGQVARIHQEDFCQALGVPSAKKYQNEGGPSFINCFELLKSTAQPAVDRNTLASMLVFNYLIGNMDAHGKNFSLLHHAKSTIRLAPFYDLVCTLVYPRLSKKLAMKMGSQYEFDRIYARHWEQLCEGAGYRFLAMKKLILQQSEAILNAAMQEREEFVAANGDNLIINKIINVIETNVAKLRKDFSGS